jgi:hypothetical protein
MTAPTRKAGARPLWPRGCLLQSRDLSVVKFLARRSATGMKDDVWCMTSSKQDSAGFKERQIPPKKVIATAKEL